MNAHLARLNPNFGVKAAGHFSAFQINLDYTENHLQASRLRVYYLNSKYITQWYNFYTNNFFHFTFFRDTLEEIIAGDSMSSKTSQPGLQVAVNREPNSFCFDLIRGLAETFNGIKNPKLLRSLWNCV